MGRFEKERDILEKVIGFDRMVKIYYKSMFKQVSKGRSAEKYIIIPYTTKLLGAVTVFHDFITYIPFCEKRGLIPIMSWGPGTSLESIKDQDNLWESFICQRNVKDILAGDTAYLLNRSHKNLWNIKVEFAREFLLKEVKDWSAYYRDLNRLVMPYYEVNDNIKNDIEKFLALHKGFGEKSLAVAMREDLSIDRLEAADDPEVIAILKRHPINPSLEDSIEKIKRYIDQRGGMESYDHIFLSTINEDTIARFTEEFGDKVIYIDRQRWPNSFWKVPKEQKAGRFWDPKREEAYCKELLLMAMCGEIIGTKGNQLSQALILNAGKYKNVTMFENLNKDIKVTYSYLLDQFFDEI